MSNQHDEMQRVEFRLFSFGNDNAIKLLPPEGTMVFQGIGFPTDFEDCTCIPKGPVGFLSITGYTILDAQWYKPAQSINREDIPQNLSGSPRVKGYLCHKLRPNTNIYPISSLHVAGFEVHLVLFENKRIIYKRLGHAVEVDLKQVPNDQRFTLSIEWGYEHIEIRVSWLEGVDLEEYFSGDGVSYKNLETYNPPRVGKLIQHRDRTEFGTSIIPATIARAIWKQSEKFIDDDIKGKPPQDARVARRFFKDKKDFTNTLLNIFDEIQKTLMRAKPHAFWDGNVPKSEPHAGASLRLFFEAFCSLKNIMIFQEDPSRSGNVDFVFTGISSDMENLTLVLELKNAHSDKLERGITHQLPKYITEREPDYGVYGVLWYKGQDFNFPAYKTIEDCISHLENIKHQLVSSIVAFDVSFHTPASKL